MKLLQGQLDLLNAQKTRVEANLTAHADRARGDGGRAGSGAGRNRRAWTRRSSSWRTRSRVEQDAAARTKLETELADAEHAATTRWCRTNRCKLAKSQTLERYIEKGKTWVDSLQNQAATQLVLINKLQTDTKQRVVLYDALTSSR